MTPQERKLIDELFGRLASLENAPRDPDAVRAINDGLAHAPNALYALVQTVLVQDEALKRADARIQELESQLGGQPEQGGEQPGFLDSMRDALLGKSRGSVPSVGPDAGRSSAWGNTAGNAGGPPPGYPPAGYAQGGYGQSPAGPAWGGAGGGGSSFLGTAAASAAGVVGGALLMNSFRNMFGGHNYSAFDNTNAGSPWGGGSSLGNTDMARDAGVDDIGRGDTRQTGLFDSSNGDNDSFDNGGSDNDDFDVGGDFGGGDDSDNA